MFAEIRKLWIIGFMNTVGHGMVKALGLTCALSLAVFVVTGCSGQRQTDASSTYTPKPIVTATGSAPAATPWSLAEAQAACVRELGQWSWGDARFSPDPPTFRGGLGIQPQLATVNFTECMLRQISAPGAPSRAQVNSNGSWRFQHSGVPLHMTATWSDNSGTITIATERSDNT